MRHIIRRLLALVLALFCEILAAISAAFRWLGQQSLGAIQTSSSWWHRTFRNHPHLEALVLAVGYGVLVEPGVAELRKETMLVLTRFAMIA